YPRDKTIQELFEEQVERTPNNIAVVFEKSKLTYIELNKKSNQLARVLKEKGVGPDSIVGIMVERSIEMVVGIMAILKAGGAYLPIDPEYPVERIRYMLKDSKTKVILTKNTILKSIEFDGEIVDLEDEKISSRESYNLNKINTPQDLAYIIYTSGTTGSPKGVMIEHKNVVSLMFNNKMEFDFNEKDVWTMFHSYCFDFSVWEMYGALLYGGRLVLFPKDKAIDTEEFLKILKEEKVTVLNQIPTPFYSLMNKELASSEKELSLRYVIFGGEALKPEMLKEWIKKYPKTKLINMYGITETTVHVTYKEIGEKEINGIISNIGKSIPTLTTYIMDTNLKLLPIGVPGELCVGGEGVGRGYLNREELTEAKFVANPYKSEERIYRSGDLARWLPDGNMEYLGRIDHQVKIRGFRIELGEI
ncbi:amino acid adenylation domain-containing protein, partial [Solibacillus sp. MA9]